VGLTPQQIQVHVEFDLREVTFFARGPLDIKPTIVKVPFAILKGVFSQLLKAEAEDELTILSGVGDQVAKGSKV
jgi:hypothetical protein